MRRFILIMIILSALITTSVSLAQQPGNPPEQTHLVRDGENLYTIAAQYGVTVTSLAELNGITDYNLVRIGQRLRIPTQQSPLAPPLPAQAQPAEPVVEITPVAVNDASAVGFAYGAQVYLPGQDAAQITAALQDLGVTWVQHRIDWADYETTRGQINFAALDAIVQPLDAAGLNILLTLTAAPDWARATTVDDGPPNVDADFGAFAGAVATHYKGVVDAYEIWSEPNLRSAWNGKTISGETYVTLLKWGYNAIKMADPVALVVTAGLSPTQTNDGVNAVDDRVFLQQMYQAGVADFSDAIGAHPGGWANPPDSTCCGNNRPAVPAWDDQKAFFFMETLRDYRNLMNSNGDDGTFLWVTGFGWGSAAGISTPLNPDFGFVGFTDAQEQGQHIVRAFQLGRDLSYVGPMMVDNLNFCPAFGRDGVECYWSLVDSAGANRPAFEAIKLVTP